MTLRRRVAILLGLTLALVVLFEIYFGMYLSYQNIHNYEISLVERNVNRAKHVIDIELEHLSIFLTDWSQWDDVYRFVVDRNQPFVRDNLTDLFYRTSRIHYLAILNQQGEFAFAHGYDFVLDKELPFAEMTPKWYSSHKKLWYFENINDSITGIIKTSHGLMLYVARPIVTSHNLGPIRGTIIMGQLIDKEMLDRISKNLEMKVSIIPTTEKHPLNTDINVEKFWVDSEVVGDQADNMLIGNTFIHELSTGIHLHLRVWMPRELKRIMRLNTTNSIVNQSAILILFGAFWWLLSRTLLKRIEALRTDVSHIGDCGDLSMRIKVPEGKDELITLSHNINRMLEGFQKSQNTLRESDRRFREIMSNIHMLGVLLDKDGTIMFANKFAQNISGRSEAELLHRNWFDLFIPKDARKSRQRDYIETIQENRDEIHSVKDIITKDGELRTIVFHGTLIRNEEGEAIGIALIGQDITDQLLAEAEIRRLGTVVESAIEAIQIVDLNMKLIYTNPAFTNIFKYSADEVLGKSFDILYSENTKSTHYKELWQRVASGEMWNGQLTMLQKDGHPIELDVSAVPLRDPGQTITHYGIFSRDVTAQNELQAQLSRSQRFVAIGELTGGIAHNFNNVLTVIMGNLDLASYATQPELNRCLTEATDACARASDLIKQLMIFSRKTQIEKKPVVIKTLLSEVANLVRNTFDRRFEIVLEPVLVQRTFNGDVSQLHEVLLNMCFNAKDALAEIPATDPRPLQIILGAKEIHIDEDLVEAEIRSGDFVCITVTDTGCGMSQEVVKHIFEPFYTTKEVGKGTGLGLSSAFGLVQQHNGWIAVSSAPNQGTKFSIFLPISDSIDQTALKSVNVTVNHGGTETILVVEDEEMVRNLSKTILKRHGYQVLEAKNGQEALEIVANQPESIDLILLDISMPEMSGIEFLDRAITINPTLRAIITSGVPLREIPPQVASSVVGEVPKPYQTAELLSTIRKVLDQAKGHTKSINT